MDKEILIRINETLFDRLEKQFSIFGVSFQEGIKIVLETFVDDNEGFVLNTKTNKSREKQVFNTIKDENKISKAMAISIFEKMGFSINKPCTYASRGDINKTNYDFYWANPRFEYLEQDWNIILNEKYQKKLILLQVPKNSFTDSDMKSRTDKYLIDLRIRCDDNSYYDFGSGNYFKEYYICMVDYSDITDPRLIEDNGLYNIK